MAILSKKIISNSLWMMLEKFIGIFGLIFVTSYVAKYIGPSNFGKIALVATLFSFVQTLTWFGNQEILFKRVSKNENSGLQYLFSTQNLRKLLFLFFTIPVLLSLYFYADFLTVVFGIATAFATYFITQDIYAIYNNATLNSYINALVNMLGLIVALIIRYIVVALEMNYAFLAIPIILTTLIPFLLKKYIFNKKQQATSISVGRYQRYYFFAGGSLVMSTLAISFYTQINSLLLAALTSTRELGLYAAAVTLGMSWSFINASIITSVLSRIYREKNSYHSYIMVAKLNMIIFFISLIAIVVLAVFGSWMLMLLYGDAYQSAYKLLIVLGLATMCSGLGTIISRLMIKEESYHYISKKMIFVAVSALPISYIMIYFFGLKGAAYSVLFIELLSLTLFNYFYKDGLIFKIHFFAFFKDSLKSNYQE